MMKIIMKAILILIFLWYEVKAACNVCQTNGVACISKNSFHLCYGGSKLNLKQTYHCQEGTVCTDLPNICFQEGAWKPSCGDNSECGVCNASKMFACNSQTAFAFCFGSTTPTDMKGICPMGYICDANSPFICVPQDKGTEPTCNNLESDDLDLQIAE